LKYPRCGGRLPHTGFQKEILEPLGVAVEMILSMMAFDRERKDTTSRPAGGWSEWLESEFGFVSNPAIGAPEAMFCWDFV